MQTITLISTRHEELGRCTSDALYKIFQTISPEIIFEEIPTKYFQDHYVSRTRHNLEVDTINRYIENYKVEHVLVDTDDIPGEEFFEDHRRMLKRVEGLTDQSGFDYRTLMDKNMEYSAMHGFNYLNSKYSISYYADIDDAVEKGLEKLNNEKLNETIKSWNAFQNRREHEMLQNIYRYSNEHKYGNAIFTLGAWHRKSIRQKIQQYALKEKLKLNWQFYNE